MVSTHALLTFAATAFLLIVVPGPSVMFVVSRGVALGRRAAILTVLGNAGGAYTQVLLVAGGLGALVQRSRRVYTAVRLVGPPYLIYLGVQPFRHRRQLHLSTESSGPARSNRRLLLD